MTASGQISTPTSRSRSGSRLGSGHPKRAGKPRAKIIELRHQRNLSLSCKPSISSGTSGEAGACGCELPKPAAGSGLLTAALLPRHLELELLEPVVAARSSGSSDHL